MLPTRYPQFLAHVFDRADTPNGWYFDEEYEPFGSEDQELAELVLAVLSRSSTDLVAFSDSQINHGLSFLFNNSCSDTVHSVKAAAVREETKLRIIAAFSELYSSVFLERCKPVLGHLSQPGGSPVNSICYMLWDVSPLSYWEDYPDSEGYYEALAQVLAGALRLPHIACIESALHGLGHLHCYCPGPVEDILSAYLQSPCRPDGALLEYAERARTGYVL
jgi:hypothetical protein